MWSYTSTEHCGAGGIIGRLHVDVVRSTASSLATKEILSVQMELVSHSCLLVERHWPHATDGVAVRIRRKQQTIMAGKSSS